MGLVRLFLALSVVANHCNSILGFGFVGGKLAVQSFFMISGFYMALVLNKKYINSNNSYSLFISNRLYRLLPVYWTVLLVAVFYAIFTNSGPIKELNEYLSEGNQMNVFTYIYLGASNLLLFGQDVLLFTGIDPDSGSMFFTKNFRSSEIQLHNFLFVPQAWSISIELMFYLIAPFICRRKMKWLVLLALISLAIRFVLFKFNLYREPWNYRFFPLEFVFFIIGIILFRISDKWQDSLILKNAGYFIIPLVLIVILDYYSLPVMPYKDVLFLSGFGIALPFIFIVSKKWKVDRWIGELSYPIYIVHLLLMSILMNYYPFSDFYFGFYVALLSIIASFGLIVFVSEPIEKFRQSRLKNQN